MWGMAGRWAQSACLVAVSPGRVRSRPAAIPWGLDVDSRAAFSLPQDIPALSSGLPSRPVVWREVAFLLWRKGLPGAVPEPVGGWRKHPPGRVPHVPDGHGRGRGGMMTEGAHPAGCAPSLCLRERHAPPVRCLFSPVPRVVVGPWTALAALGTRAALATFGTRTALALHISFGLLDEHAA